MSCIHVSIVNADSRALNDSEPKSDSLLKLDNFSFADGDPDAMFFQEIPSVVTPSRMEQKPWHSHYLLNLAQTGQ
jgi:hypothetical protein